MMKKNLNFLKSLKTPLLALSIAAGCTCYSCSPKEEAEVICLEQTETEPAASLQEEPETEEESGTEAVCFVHVCGQVKNPGLYQVEPDCRIWDAVELAGGFLPEADGQYLNLAQPVTDGMQILVPTKEQALEWGPRSSAGTGAADAGQTAKVNLNTAGKEELMTLKGIGQSKAEDIIQYRETSGPFQKIEDIMNLPGIKDAAFQKIKDSITV